MAGSCSGLTFRGPTTAATPGDGGVDASKYVSGPLGLAVCDKGETGAAEVPMAAPAPAPAVPMLGGGVPGVVAVAEPPTAGKLSPGATGFTVLAVSGDKAGGCAGTSTTFCDGGVVVVVVVVVVPAAAGGVAVRSGVAPAAGSTSAASSPSSAGGAWGTCKWPTGLRAALSISKDCAAATGAKAKTNPIAATAGKKRRAERKSLPFAAS
jgi:hypothetical protein